METDKNDNGLIINFLNKNYTLKNNQIKDNIDDSIISPKNLNKDLTYKTLVNWLYDNEMTDMLVNWSLPEIKETGVLNFYASGFSSYITAIYSNDHNVFNE